jgi:hypothetical protein
MRPDPTLLSEPSARQRSWRITSAPPQASTLTAGGTREARGSTGDPARPAAIVVLAGIALWAHAGWWRPTAVVGLSVSTVLMLLYFTPLVPVHPHRQHRPDRRHRVDGSAGEDDRGSLTAARAVFRFVNVHRARPSVLPEGTRSGSMAHREVLPTA